MRSCRFLFLFFFSSSSLFSVYTSFFHITTQDDDDYNTHLNSRCHLHRALGLFVCVGCFAGAYIFSVVFHLPIYIFILFTYCFNMNLFAQASSLLAPTLQGWNIPPTSVAPTASIWFMTQECILKHSNPMQTGLFPWKPLQLNPLRQRSTCTSRISSSPGE